MPTIGDYNKSINCTEASAVAGKGSQGEAIEQTKSAADAASTIKTRKKKQKAMAVSRQFWAYDKKELKCVPVWKWPSRLVNSHSLLLYPFPPKCGPSSASLFILCSWSKLISSFPSDGKRLSANSTTNKKER